MSTLAKAGCEHTACDVTRWLREDGRSAALSRYVHRAYEIRLLERMYSTRRSGEPGRVRWIAAGYARRQDLSGVFKALASQWHDETAHLSMLSQRVMHPTYQRIIGFGRRMLPHILKQLEEEPDYWFWALRSITGENPVRDEDVGHLHAMRETWLRWGRSRGLL